MIRQELHTWFDAVGEEGNLYQIKSRIVEDITQSTSFDLSDINHRFDYLIPRFCIKDVKTDGRRDSSSSYLIK